jgi:DNA-binding transcriptional LysR family regulator
VDSRAEGETRADDREDVRRPPAAEIFPGEEPVLLGFLRRGRSERVAARIRGSFNAASALLAAAVAGAGVIRLPSFVVAELIRQGQLESLLDDSSDERFTVSLIYRTGTPPAKLRAFIDAILEELPRRLQISPPSPARSIRQAGGTGQIE